ncbi:MAG: glycosyltransferase family 4 protein [Thermoanaerobaculia bacterium]
MRVLHIITSLGLGGAENVLLRLLQRTTATSEVIVLQRPDIVADAIRASGVAVHSLGLRSKLTTPLGVSRLMRWSRRFRPDVVQTWLYAADLCGGPVRLATGAPIIWNVRSTTNDLPFGTRAVMRLAAATSRMIPTRIVCGSRAAAAFHSRAGYPTEKLEVIPNGFDLDRFRPRPDTTQALRSEWGVPPNAVVVGLVGRFDPLKDHHNFVRAAERITNANANVHFVLCGDGITAGNDVLMSWITEGGIAARTHLLGRRLDVEQITAALDIACLSSASEGFPNVVGEAMACAVPCVVTDVGDAAEIVGNTGVVVPPHDPEALAAGCLRLIEIGADARRELGSRARTRIEEHYSLDVMVNRYDALYERVGSARL